MEQYLIGAAAALFGWIVFQLPQITNGKARWIEVVSHSGVALLVGFVSISALDWYKPVNTQNLAWYTSVSAVAGTMADSIISQFQKAFISVFNSKFKKGAD
jgi:hypothetical protein